MPRLIFNISFKKYTRLHFELEPFDSKPANRKSENRLQTNKNKSRFQSPCHQHTSETFLSLASATLHWLHWKTAFCEGHRLSLTVLETLRSDNEKRPTKTNDELWVAVHMCVVNVLYIDFVVKVKFVYEKHNSLSLRKVSIFFSCLNPFT